MFNKTHEDVTFLNAPTNGTTKVATPDGIVTLENGSPGKLHMKRSRKNVPITVNCPDGTSRTGEIVTEFDYLRGGALNILNIPIGWIVDPFSNNAFLYDPVDVAAYCAGSRQPVKTAPLAPLGID